VENREPYPRKRNQEREIRIRRKESDRKKKERERHQEKNSIIGKNLVQKFQWICLAHNKVLSLSYKAGVHAKKGTPLQ